MYKDLAGLVLLCILFLIVQTWNKFWVRWTTAIANGEADNSRSSGAPILPQGEGMLTGDPAQGVSTDLLSSPPQGAGTWSTNGELKLSRAIMVARAEREPFVKVFFKLDYTRSETHTLQLKVDQVDFGVRKYCTRNCGATSQQCGKMCETVFINNMKFQVRPKPWAQDCSRIQLLPDDKPQDFQKQQSSKLNLLFPCLSPRKASVSVGLSNTVAHAVPEHQWSSVCGEDASNSVSWIWRLNTYEDGRELKLNRSSWWSVPVLGIKPSHMHFHSETIKAEASWELRTGAELQQQWLEWNVTISLDIAELKRKRWLRRYSVTTVPILPFDGVLQFPELTKRAQD